MLYLVLQEAGESLQEIQKLLVALLGFGPGWIKGRSTGKPLQGLRVILLIFMQLTQVKHSIVLLLQQWGLAPGLLGSVAGLRGSSGLE